MLHTTDYYAFQAHGAEPYKHTKQQQQPLGLPPQRQRKLKHRLMNRWNILTSSGVFYLLNNVFQFSKQSMPRIYLIVTVFYLRFLR